MREVRTMLKLILGLAIAIAMAVGIGAWSTRRSSLPKVGVGTDPGRVREAKDVSSLEPAVGNCLIAFSSGCFWGAEEAFRKTPGVVATAVGFMGGTSKFPSYEVAHRTGHLETVLVEFDPNRVSIRDLLKVFWTLPLSKKAEVDGKSRLVHRAAIWVYKPDHVTIMKNDRDAEQAILNTKLAVKIAPALPFYIAEEYHQQYSEKSGKDLCPVGP